MYMAEEISKLEHEEYEKTKTGRRTRKPYVGDARKADPETQRQLDIFADRKRPIMDKSKIIKQRRSMNR